MAVNKNESKKQESLISLKKLNIKDLPSEPGVYLFYDKTKKIIYIGKAKILKNRVSSYFVKKDLLTPKTAEMLENAEYISFIKTQSEVEAFLLEAALIKQYKPKYNIQLKDDKSYVHIIVEDQEIDKSILGRNENLNKDTKAQLNGKRESLQKPNVEILRKVYVGRLNIRKTNSNIVKAIGPFVEASTTKKVLKALRRIFPHASCSKTKFLEYRKKGRPCLYGHIGLCPAPCKDPKKHKTNKKNIQRLINFILKGRDKYVREQEKKMKKLSKELRFEEALQIRRELEKISNLQLATVLPDQYTENPNLIYDIYEKRMQDIKELFGMKAIPSRIECYDISNIMGQWATASMVVSEKGKLAKDQYRKFRIKFTKGINDFGMLAEVIKRRIKKDWPQPDLLLIDGGKGQVSSVLKATEGTPFENILTVGIFKPHDFFVVNSKNYEKATGKKLNSATALATNWYILRPQKSLGYEHLRELRDEAHRFAKGYHKKLRDRIDN